MSTSTDTHRHGRREGGANKRHALYLTNQSDTNAGFSILQSDDYNEMKGSGKRVAFTCFSGMHKLLMNIPPRHKEL